MASANIRLVRCDGSREKYVRSNKKAVQVKGAEFIMLGISDTVRKIIVITCGLGLFFCALSFIFYPTLAGGAGISAGIAIGAILASIKLIFLERSLRKSIEMEKKQSAKYARTQYLIRLVLIAPILVIVAVNHPTVNLFGVFAGFASAHIATYVSGRILSKSEKQ